MRIRAVVAIALLLLPAASSAQRFPLPGLPRRGAGRPEERPPRQPEPIARALAYRRWRLSVESYPLISHVQSPSFTVSGRRSSSTSFGGGTRAEYLLTPQVSATLDLTSSLFGSPLHVQTAEMGTRLRPERTERRAYPFVDLRVGYISAFDSRVGPIAIDEPFGVPVAVGMYGARYSRGFGGAAGVGMEYTLTRSLSLTTAASVMRSSMTAHDYQGFQTNSPGFGMTSYRYTLGVKYNPVRMIIPSGTDRP